MGVLLSWELNLSRRYLSLRPLAELTVFERQRILAEAWLEQQASDWLQSWQGELGEQSRDLLALGQELKPEPMADLLEPALERVLRDPEDWPAQLVLLISRRVFQGLEGRLQTQPFAHAEALLAYAQQTLLRRVLPPVENTDLSILVPTYNRLGMLQRLIRSIQAQTDSRWQLWIADDASNDGTEAYLQALSRQDERIHYLRKEQNTGFYDTLSLLYERAETELVMNVSDDDLLMPNCVADTRRCFERFPWIALGGGGYYLLNQQGTKLQAKQYGPYYVDTTPVNMQRELQRCGIINPVFGGGMLLRKSVLQAISADDPNTFGQRRYSCWDWWVVMRLLSRYEVAYAPSIVAVYTNRMDASQMTFNQDWGRPFAGLLQQLIQDYWAYFGAHTYPESILRYFQTTVLEPNLVQSFRACLNQHRQASELDDFVAKQRSGWEIYRWLMQEVLPQASQEASACQLNEITVAGLSGGEIEGLRENQGPPVLQALIRELLREAQTES